MRRYIKFYRILIIFLYLLLLLTACKRVFLDPLDPASDNYQGYPVYDEEDIPPDVVLILNNVKPEQGSSTIDTTPLLEWKTVANATSYQVQISNTQEGLLEVSSITVNQANYQIPLDDKFAYRDICYWRVRAVSQENKYSPWSEVQFFSIDWDISWVGLVPGNNSTSVDTTPLIQWNPINTAISYQIRYANNRDSLIAESPRDTDLSECQITEPFVMNSFVHWQVRAINEDGVPSDWSDLFIFNISMDITWSGINPQEGETIDDTTPVLSWGSVGGIESYQIQYLMNSTDFPDLPIYDTEETEFQIEEAIPLGTNIFWKVRGINEDGVPTDWSSAFNFTVQWDVTWTGINPLDDGTTSDTTPLLNWNNIPLAISYEVEYAFSQEDLKGDNPIAAEVSEYQIPAEEAFSLEDIIFWHIRAINEDNVKSNWSPIYSFSIKNNAKAITSFYFDNPAATGVINEADKTISITVPYGTDVTALTPTILHTGASISPTSGIPQNFSNARTYTVTAADSTTVDYLVTVSVALNPAKAITSFNFDNPAATGVINESEKTISITVPYGTDVTALTPTIVHTGASISPASGTPQNFSNPRTYTVTAADSTTVDYLVTVSVALNPAKAITSFNFDNPAATGVINESEKTISITVPYGTDVTVLTPTIIHAGASISPASGTPQNFSNPKNYTVTAADSTTVDYLVTVSVALNPAKAITSFNFDNPAATGVINESEKTISITVPYGTDVTVLTPTIVHTGASISPTSGIPQNFSNPRTYTVTAADSTTVDYTISVYIEPASNDCDLNFLTVNTGTIEPEFDPITINYILSVPNAITSITVTATTSDSNAIIDFEPSNTINLEIGDNLLKIIVTAENNVNFKEYYLVIKRSGDYFSELIGVLKFVPAGTFQRDSISSNLSYVSAFRISPFEITRDQFQSIIGYDPSSVTYSGGIDNPVQRVNWYHAITFCNKLSITEGLTPVYYVDGVDFNSITYGQIPNYDEDETWDSVTVDWNADGYRLPTEMEWMWAAMGADKSESGELNTDGYLKTFSGSNGNNFINDYVWYNENSESMTHPVGVKLPNELGLYDMSGNVREWCWDWYGDNGTYPIYSITGLVIDYRGPVNGNRRIHRGGGWADEPSYCNIARRDNNSSPALGSTDYGFRVVRP